MKKAMGMIACAGMLAALSALAQAPAAGENKAGTPPQRPPECKLGSGPRGAGLFHDLNLTPEQKEKVKQIVEQQMEQNKAVRESALALRQQLKEQMSSGNPDQGKVTDLRRQLAEVNASLAASRAEGLKEIKALLTPEQSEQLAKKMAAFREHREQAMKQRHERMEKRQQHNDKTSPAAPTA